MKRAIPIISLFTLLLISSISYAQTQNPYADFTPVELKNNKDYAKNFNPRDYDAKILYKCMVDIVNTFRMQYKFIEPLLQETRLDSAAQMQAAYQAKKDEKTDQNSAPYRTVGDRLKKYGLSSVGVEVVSKAKAHKGVDEYSYYNLCMELMASILKNVKTAEILLNKRYTYIGFGYQCDPNLNSMYISIVLSNDLVFTDDKPDSKTKDLPYQKGRAGLGKFDTKTCQRCLEDISLEVLTDYIVIRGDEVTLTCNNHRDLRKMIGKEGDALVLDFVKHSSYECNDNIKDNDFTHRGFTSKPITYQKILENNEETDTKSGKLDAVIAKIPDFIDIDEPFDLNIIVIKNKNIPCRILFKKNIQVKNWEYNEKINLIKDVISIKNTGEWTLTEEEGIVEFTIPMPLNKTEFTQDDIALAMKDLNHPQYKIQGVGIISYHSLDHANDNAQLTLQKKKTEALAKVLARKLGVASITKISYQENWDDFKRDVIEHNFHYDLTLGTKEEAITQLKADQGKIAKILEQDFLRKHRYAKIKLQVTYPINGNLEHEFVLYKFNKAIEEKNLAFAMSIQKYILNKVEEKKYSTSILNRMQIPATKEFQPFLTNNLYMQYWLSEKLSPTMAEEAQKIFNLDNSSSAASFNACVAKVSKAEFKTIADINKLQVEVDKLYTMQQIPKDAAASLNLELQFKIITFIKSKPFSQEFETLLTNTYAKIKSIVNPKTLNWRNAYKLSYYFIINQDYKYALSLMDPFISNEDISTDFLLCYISVAATQEEAFLSSLFTKAVSRAAEKAPTQLCTLFNKLPISIFDNKEAQKTICKTCNL